MPSVLDSEPSLFSTICPGPTPAQSTEQVFSKYLLNIWMNEAARAIVCLKKTSLGNSAGGTTELAGSRGQGSRYSLGHNCLKCPCPCTPLCCSVIHNRMHLPRHGNSSWVDRKADTKPLLIKKHLQLEWSSGKHKVPCLLMGLMSTCVENIQWTVSGLSPNPEPSKGNKISSHSLVCYLLCKSQKLNSWKTRWPRKSSFTFLWVIHENNV